MSTPKSPCYGAHSGLGVQLGYRKFPHFSTFCSKTHHVLGKTVACVNWAIGNVHKFFRHGVLEPLAQQPKLEGFILFGCCDNCRSVGTTGRRSHVWKWGRFAGHFPRLLHGGSCRSGCNFSSHSCGEARRKRKPWSLRMDPIVLRATTIAMPTELVKNK